MVLRCGDDWEVGARVAGGSFGDVYVGHNPLSGQLAAIKLEKQRNGTSSTSWSQEVKMYRCVTPHPGVPALLWHGTASDGRRGLALELLGPSLDDLFHALERSISVPTLAACAITLIDLIAWLHSRGIVHRDVKPQNFLCGRIALGDENEPCNAHVAFSARVDDVFVVDFGLAKAFNTRSGHVQFKRHQGRAGTARYASINTHKGHMQSRRDDLEAIGYMLVFLHKGRLPWQGVKASSRRRKHKRICAVKSATSLQELCDGMPPAFSLFLEYARNLGFTEQPNYQYCKSLFRHVLHEQPCAAPDWAQLDPASFACISALTATQRSASATSTGQSGTEARASVLKGTLATGAIVPAPNGDTADADDGGDGPPAAGTPGGGAGAGGSGLALRATPLEQGGRADGQSGCRLESVAAASSASRRLGERSACAQRTAQRARCAETMKRKAEALASRPWSPRRTRSHVRQRVA